MDSEDRAGGGRRCGLFLREGRRRCESFVGGSSWGRWLWRAATRRSPTTARRGRPSAARRMPLRVTQGATEEPEAEVAPSGCDPTKPPHDESCVIDDAFGIFVSPAGSDANPGSKSAPVRSIGHGMDLAKAAAKRVYICAGSYPEQLVVGTSRDGVNVYGALDCATWTYGAANKVVVAPAQSGYALEIRRPADGGDVRGHRVRCAERERGVQGASSVAVFVSGSQNVALHRVTMVAGSGTDGMPGPPQGPSDWYGTPPDYSELNGISAGDAGGAPSTTCTCADQASSIGRSGRWPDEHSHACCRTALVRRRRGRGGGHERHPMQLAWRRSATAAMHRLPLADTPSTSLGACSATGWTPGVGVPGANGKPGQGGGGGGNGTLSSGSGGSGACGGCGGWGGKGGQGGGASIALLSFQSSITLAGCSLTAKAAGNGGAEELPKRARRGARRACRQDRESVLAAPAAPEAPAQGATADKAAREASRSGLAT